MSAAESVQPSGPCVLIHDEGASRVLTLNRPAKRNALSDVLLAELCSAIESAQTDDAVRSIVVRGAGSSFCSGRDQADMGRGKAGQVVLQDESLEHTVGIFTRALRLLMHSPKPTIAAVHGHALAGGQALSLACDFVVAERDAQFGNPEIRYGFPAAMNTVLLARHLGRRKALEIAITGNTWRAEDYAALGLVNRLTEPGGLDLGVRSFCENLNVLAPWAVRRTKQLLMAAEDMGLDELLASGDGLNQLLRLNAQIQGLFQDKV